MPCRAVDDNDVLCPFHELAALQLAHRRLVHLAGRDVEIGQTLVGWEARHIGLGLSLPGQLNPVHRRLHVVVGPTLWKAAKDADAVPSRIEQYLMRLQLIGSDEEGAAMGQLGMRVLQFRAIAANHRVVFAPVELEGFPRAERQGDEYTAPCGPLLASALNWRRPQSGCRTPYSRAPRDRRATSSAFRAACGTLQPPSSTT